MFKFVCYLFEPVTGRWDCLEFYSSVSDLIEFCHEYCLDLYKVLNAVIDNRKYADENIMIFMEDSNGKWKA